MIGKLFRRGGFAAKHLSYANVMATLAVFVALGGTSYAVTQISGSQITNRSIAGKKLKLHTVTSGELRDLVVSAGRRRHHGRHHHTAADASTASATSTSAAIITLSVGQSATILQSGPFTYTARCQSDSNGRPVTGIEAESSEAGSLVDSADTSGGRGLPSPYELSAGQPVWVVPPTYDAAGYKLSRMVNGAYMIAPSGATLIANITYGTRLFGSDCWVSGFGVD